MIKLLFTGDFYPSPLLENLNGNGDGNRIYNDFISVLDGNDITITNLESPLFDRSTPIKKVGPALKASTASIEILKRGHFNLAALANNHILDHGNEGLVSTLNVCRGSGINTVGAGKNAYQARKPFITYN